MTADATGYLIAGLAVAVSIIGWRSRHMVACLAGAGLWIALWYYINDQGTLVTGALLQIITVCCFGMAIAMLLLGVFQGIRVRSTNDVETPYNENEHSGVKGFLHKLNADETPKPPRGGRSQFYESEEEHRARVHKAISPKRRRY